MDLNITLILFGSLSLAGSVAYVLARRKDNIALSAIAKVTASSAFVALAIVNGATQTPYGSLVLTALILSWLGDMLLLSLEATFLLGGIGAFFAAHLVFSIAFANNVLDITAGLFAFCVAFVLGILVLRWLWKYLAGIYLIAVPAYLIAIVSMVALAFAASAASLPSTVAIGSAAFALSDVSVARDRFVRRSIANKAWGLPLYYLAQILFAGSVSLAG